MRKGDIGAEVADLQRRLNSVGFNLVVDAFFDVKTEAAVIAFQRRVGLVADGIAGPKTISVLLSGERNKKLLSEADLEIAAIRLGVQLAAIKAVNNVESRGKGFLDDGRPIILFERHVMLRRLETHGMDGDAIAVKNPGIVNAKRGGYIGNGAEYARLAAAIQIHPQAALESCSWGQFQIMGYHWEALGFKSIETFVDAMKRSEADQLEAFCRFIEDDPALHKALKTRNWSKFAQIYNGPAYKENLYDVKLARAFDRLTPAPEAEAA